jgi:hypothetical protein
MKDEAREKQAFEVFLAHDRQDTCAICARFARRKDEG